MSQNKSLQFPGSRSSHLTQLEQTTLQAFDSSTFPLQTPDSNLLLEVVFVQSLSCIWLCDPLWPHGLQHTSLPCPSPYPKVCSNSRPLSWWCHPTISSSVIPFSRLQSFPASGSFQISQLFSSSGQSTGVSASASVLPMNIQDWFPLGLTSWISLQSKGLSTRKIIYISDNTLPR